jgi:hypothetical protein
VVGLAINLGSLFTKVGLGAVLGSVSVITSITTAFDDINKSSDSNVYMLDVFIMLAAMFALACLAAFALGLVGSMAGCMVFTVIGAILSIVREWYINTHPGAFGKVDIFEKYYFKRLVICQ